MTDAKAVATLPHRRTRATPAQRAAAAATLPRAGSVAAPDARDILRRVAILIHQHVLRGEQELGGVTSTPLPPDATPLFRPGAGVPHASSWSPARRTPAFLPTTPLPVTPSGARLHALLSPILGATRSSVVAATPRGQSSSPGLAPWFLPSTPAAAAAGPSGASRAPRAPSFALASPRLGVSSRGLPALVIRRHDVDDDGRVSPAPRGWLDGIAGWFGFGPDRDRAGRGSAAGRLDEPLLGLPAAPSRRPSAAVSRLRSWSTESSADPGPSTARAQRHVAVPVAALAAASASAAHTPRLTSAGTGPPTPDLGPTASQVAATSEAIQAEALREAVWGEDDPYGGVPLPSLRFHEREFDCPRFSVVFPSASTQPSLLAGGPHAVRRYPRHHRVPTPRAVEELAALLYREAEVRRFAPPRDWKRPLPRLTPLAPRPRAPQLTPECSVIALIYAERLMDKAGVTLLACNWRPVLVASLLLASKVWQDLSTWNAEFTDILADWPLPGVNELERRFVSALGFDLFITPSTFARYYFALRSLGEEVGFRRRLMGAVLADKLRPDDSTPPKAAGAPAPGRPAADRNPTAGSYAAPAGIKRGGTGLRRAATMMRGEPATAKQGAAAAKAATGAGGGYSSDSSASEGGSDAYCRSV